MSTSSPDFIVPSAGDTSFFSRSARNDSPYPSVHVRSRNTSPSMSPNRAENHHAPSHQHLPSRQFQQRRNQYLSHVVNSSDQVLLPAPQGGAAPRQHTTTPTNNARPNLNVDTAKGSNSGKMYSSMIPPNKPLELPRNKFPQPFNGSSNPHYAPPPSDRPAFHGHSHSYGDVPFSTHPSSQNSNSLLFPPNNSSSNDNDSSTVPDGSSLPMAQGGGRYHPHVASLQQPQQQQQQHQPQQQQQQQQLLQQQHKQLGQPQFQHQYQLAKTQSADPALQLGMNNVFANGGHVYSEKAALLENGSNDFSPISISSASSDGTTLVSNYVQPSPHFQNHAASPTPSASSSFSSPSQSSHHYQGNFGHHQPALLSKNLNHSVPSPTLLSCRPISRGGVNFSRPSTFYKLENLQPDTSTLAMPPPTPSSAGTRQGSVSSTASSEDISGNSPVRSVSSDLSSGSSPSTSASSSSSQKPSEAQNNTKHSSNNNQLSIFTSSSSHSTYSSPLSSPLNSQAPLLPTPPASVDTLHSPKIRGRSQDGSKGATIATGSTPANLTSQYHRRFSIRRIDTNNSTTDSLDVSNDTKVTTPEIPQSQFVPSHSMQKSRSISDNISSPYRSPNLSSSPSSSPSGRQYSASSHGHSHSHSYLHAATPSTGSSAPNWQSFISSTPLPLPSEGTRQTSLPLLSATTQNTVNNSPHGSYNKESATTATSIYNSHQQKIYATSTSTTTTTASAGNGSNPNTLFSSALHAPTRSVSSVSTNATSIIDDPNQQQDAFSMTASSPPPPLSEHGTFPKKTQSPPFSFPATTTFSAPPSRQASSSSHLDINPSTSDHGKKPFAQTADRHKSMTVFTGGFGDDGERAPPMPTNLAGNKITTVATNRSDSDSFPISAALSSNSASDEGSFGSGKNNDGREKNNSSGPNDNTDDNGENNENSDNSVGKPRRAPKYCFKCKQPIPGHFVRALGCIYHMECFCCYDCGKQCSSKFFPVEAPYEIPETNNLIPLCEHDYFGRQDLLCCVCDGALRGSYITALGKKYHVEHFTCSLCSTVFGNDDSYYEHENNIYCRYHYSTLYAAKCEGCKTAILKQFVELFRGGREQQWHPECYMINKFWNVMISPTKLKVYESSNRIEEDGTEEDENESGGGSNNEARESTEDKEHSDQSEQTTEAPSVALVTTTSTSSSSHSDGTQYALDKRSQHLDPRDKAMSSPDPETRDRVLLTEQEAERKAFHIWSVLCGYEEATAACISDMLQFATSSRYSDALLATSRLVAKIEVLLSAIDTLIAHIDPLLSALTSIDQSTPEELADEDPEFLNLIEVVRNAGFTQLHKEPKTLCKKVVSFMSLLSKSRDRSVRSSGLSRELLDSVTSMAHYLKLLIRYGLSNSLRYDRAFPTGNLVVIFLDKVATHDQIPANPLETLSVSGKANDKCLACEDSTEDDCAVLDDNKLWHLDCLACSKCEKPLGSRVKDARYLRSEKVVVCDTCLKPDDEFMDNFVVVTKLNQFIYLVKIALARLRLVLKSYDKRDATAGSTQAASSGSVVKIQDSRPVLGSRRSTSSGIPMSAESQRQKQQQKQPQIQPAQQPQSQDVQTLPSSQAQQFKQPTSPSQPQQKQPTQQSLKPAQVQQQLQLQQQQYSAGLRSAENSYMTTLKDIRKLRSTRLSQRLSESSRRARRSRILDIPDSEHGLLGKNDSSTSLPVGSRGGDVADNQSPQQMVKMHLNQNNPNYHHTQLQQQQQLASHPQQHPQPKDKAASGQQQQQFQQQKPFQYPSSPDYISSSRRGSANRDDNILENVLSPSSESALPRDHAQQQSSGRPSTSSQPSSPSLLQHPPTSPQNSSSAAAPSFTKGLKGRKFGGGSQKRRRKLMIEDDPINRHEYTQLDRTTDLLKSEKSLILDDIPRIVAAEQARELRPNAYRHRRQELSTDEEVTVQDVHEKKPTVEKYMSELTPRELFIVRHIAVSILHPLVSVWFSLDDLCEVINVRKPPSLWVKFNKAFNLNDRSASEDRKKQRKTGVFGVSLEQQVEQYGVDSSFGVGPSPLRIPAFVDECISAMRQMDMSVEGVFRKNGNIRRSKELATMVDNNPDYAGMFTDENPIQLAALFKRYLRELPDSLMTFKLQKLWVNSQEITDIDDRVRVMHLACCILPSSHRDVMEVLFYFLYWTSSFSHIDEESGSKMDIHNLSTVITPNILYPKRKEGSPPDSSEGYFLAIEAVDTLIKEYDRFAKVPHEVLDILHNEFATIPADITSKEVFSRIENYKSVHKIPPPALSVDPIKDREPKEYQIPTHYGPSQVRRVSDTNTRSASGAPNAGGAEGNVSGGSSSGSSGSNAGNGMSATSNSSSGSSGNTNAAPGSFSKDGASYTNGSTSFPAPTAGVEMSAQSRPSTSSNNGHEFGGVYSLTTPINNHHEGGEFVHGNAKLATSEVPPVSYGRIQ